ncbi:hypothetical protein [Paenibacillus glycinis]|uniref:Uncharacterized protein n=1 Tax=Paenibacillus glycinis TaxID=2697035 RepID=A0ABW9XX46_9BACL|nr:hypothetical protein [Paenibacillus glycinis]NBD26817.1 hypothetical protein [Paenibacillus glycinis]
MDGRFSGAPNAAWSRMQDTGGAAHLAAETRQKTVRFGEWAECGRFFVVAREMTADPVLRAYYLAALAE